MSTAPCASALSYERFVDYWFGDLSPTEIHELEAHLVVCDACGRRAERWSLDMVEITETAREMPRSFVTSEQLAELGERAAVVDVPNAPEMQVKLGEKPVYVFRVALDPELFHTLERLDVEYLVEGHDEPVFYVSDVPLGPEPQPLHFACHSHVLSSHGDSTMRIVGTRAGERFTVREVLAHFV